MISAGDVLNLEIVKTSTYADFVGVDFTITVVSQNAAPSPMPDQTRQRSLVSP